MAMEIKDAPAPQERIYVEIHPGHCKYPYVVQVLSDEEVAMLAHPDDKAEPKVVSREPLAEYVPVEVRTAREAQEVRTTKVAAPKTKKEKE